MGWYAASVIMFIRFKDERQDYYPVYENIILIKSRNEKEALEKARCRARLDEGDSESTFYYENRPAAMIFAGVRKIIACDNPEEQPTDGTEISYSEFIVNTKKELEKLITGAPVEIMYEE